MQPDTSLRVACYWTIKRKDPKTGLLLATKTIKNVMTNTGLTGLASGWQGNAWQAPIYMALETTKALIQNAGGLLVGATSVQTDIAVDEAGDTQLVLGPNTANVETVPFSARSGTGPYTYTISGVTKTHALNDWVCRSPTAADTISSLQAEVAYDPTGNPGQRLTSLGGYSPGTAQWTMQFFLSSTQALTPIVLAGLCTPPPSQPARSTTTSSSG